MSTHAKYQPVATKEVELSNLLSKAEQGEAKEQELHKQLTLFELARVLSPYFWPDAGSDGATINRLRSSSTWLMVALSKVCSLSAPFFLSYATNALLAGKYGRACRSLVIFVSLRFASAVCKELQSVLYIKVKQQASIQLQELVFRHIHSLSLHWHLSKKTGSVMKSMDRGVDAASQLITYLFLFLIPALTECLAVIVLFFVTYKQFQLGVVVFIGVALYCAATVYITQFRKKFREETNKHDNDYHDKANDSLINYETVKYFTNELFEIRRFTQSVIRYQQATSSTQLSLAALNVSQGLLINLTLLICMLISGVAVVRGQMTIGAWVAVQSWVGTIFIPLNFLGSVYSAIFQSFIDIRNLSELLSQKPDIVDSPNSKPIVLPARTPSLTLPSQHSSHDASSLIPSQAASNPQKLLANGSSAIEDGSTLGISVEFRDVSFDYPGQGQQRGLKHVSFYVKPGSTTAIVGHTGAGKTTLSRLLFRFFDPSEGAVLLHGQDVRQCTQQSVRQAIGIVPQDTVLFNDTIYHNVAYGRLSATREEVYAAAEAAQIRTFVESLPEGWETVVGERGLKLSGGEKQRVAIARCLLKDPPVVLLDEATSALDVVTECNVQEALTALGRRRTVLVIAHRLSTIRHADQILVMDAGRLKEAGSHDELMSKPQGLYRQLWMMQTQTRA